MKDLRVWKKVGRNLLNTTVAFLMLNHYICRYCTLLERWIAASRNEGIVESVQGVRVWN